MLINYIDKIRSFTSKDKRLYSSLYKIIGFYPHNISVYKLALMHKSTMQRGDNGMYINNERLEFLGDAILDATVGDIVYRHFPGKREGFLTNTRSKLVQRETLNKLAEEMGINRLIMSAGRNSSHNNYMGGNAFEALVGAIYLDKGYEACMRFVEKRILTNNIDLDKMAYKEKNFKSKLIEWCQKNKIEIRFELLAQTKDVDGNPVFNSAIYVEDLMGSESHGFSKKESHQKAAYITFDRLKNDSKFIDKVFAAKAERIKNAEQQSAADDDKAEPKSPIEDINKTNNHLDVEPKVTIYTDVPTERDYDNLVFDLDEIHIHTGNDKSCEEIIASAEEAAFKD